MTQKFQRILDGITMYKLLAGGLSVLAVLALVLRYFEVFTYSSFGTLAILLPVIMTVCYGVNLLLAKLYGVPANHESSAITGFILFFVLAAPSDMVGWLGIVFAGLVAMASKYVITSRGAAIFNPAAFGVFIVGLLAIGDGAWWVANTGLFIPFLLFGLVVLMKLRRFELFLAFAVPALVMIIARTVGADMSVSQAFIAAVTLYPIIFLGTIMLTEPGTMPRTNYKRLFYAGIVGLVFGSQLSTEFIATSPHLALLIGNLFTFAVTRQTSTRLKLVSKKQLSPTTYDFTFQPERRIAFQAGQYMEFTLPGIPYNLRGNRRTFSIASAPDNPQIHIGIKLYEPGSAFKKALRSLPVGGQILGNHIAGDFLLPRDTAAPVVMIAGGIGITPFISMLEQMVLSGKARDVNLYYFVADASEVVYKDVLKKARDLGAKIELRPGSGKRLTDAEVATMKDSQIYISGPPGLVNAYHAQLQKSGAKAVHIDYFTGY